MFSLFGGNSLMAAIVAGFLAFVGWGYAQRLIGKSEGAANVVANIEKKDSAVAGRIRKADGLSRQSGSGGVRKHVRDPNSASE